MSAPFAKRCFLPTLAFPHRSPSSHVYFVVISTARHTPFLILTKKNNRNLNDSDKQQSKKSNEAKQYRIQSNEVMKLATSTTRLAPLLIAAVALISSSGAHTAAAAAQPSAICTTGAAPPSALTLTANGSPISAPSQRHSQPLRPASSHLSSPSRTRRRSSASPAAPLREFLRSSSMGLTFRLA